MARPRETIGQTSNPFRNSLLVHQVLKTTTVSELVPADKYGNECWWWKDNYKEVDE